MTTTRLNYINYINYNYFYFTLLYLCLMNIRLFTANSVLQSSWTVNHLDSNSHSWYSTNNIKFNFCSIIWIITLLSYMSCMFLLLVQAGSMLFSTVWVLFQCIEYTVWKLKSHFWASYISRGKSWRKLQNQDKPSL